MRRRTLVQGLVSAIAALPLRVLGLGGQERSLAAAEIDTLRAVAAAVLPSSLGETGADAVVAAFLRWLRGYRAGADLGHGYGITRARVTPDLPVDAYSRQIAAIEQAARAEGAAFGALSLEARRRIVRAALDRAAVKDLPPRPNGSHIAADLMSFYFRGAEALDLCYGARIGRETCRGLDGMERPPERI